MSYVQLLWQEIYKDGTDLQITDNGLVEAVYTIISMNMSNNLSTFFLQLERVF